MSIPGNDVFYGSFTADGNVKTIEFGTAVTSFQLWNLTQFNSTAATGVTKRAWWVKGLPDDAAFTVKNTDSAATDQSAYVTSGGFTWIDYSDLPVYGTVAVTSVSQASSAVITTTAPHGYGATNAKVLIQLANVTAMQQISGLLCTATVTGASTLTIPVDTSAFAAAGSGGTIRRIAAPKTFAPREAYISKISKAANAVVTTATDHGYSVGDMVSFRIGTGYGMSQLNYLRARITAVTSSTFTLDLDTTGFNAFAFPTSANAFLYSKPVVVPVGAYGNLPNYLGDAQNNVGYMGIQLGSAVAGAASDVIYWTASRGLLVS